MTPAVDFMGRTIEAGQTVVYPVYQGGKMFLRRMTVRQVLPDSITGCNALGRTLHVKNVRNVVIVANNPAKQPIQP